MVQKNEKIRERSDEECTHSSLFGGLGSVRSFVWLGKGFLLCGEFLSLCDVPVIGFWRIVPW